MNAPRRSVLFRALMLHFFSGISTTEAFTTPAGFCGRSRPSSVSSPSPPVSSWTRPSKAENDGDDDGTNSDEQNRDSTSDDDDDDPSFYRDLQRAKTSKLGASIPEGQLKASAAQAESDFLRAMRETQDEFQQVKREQGSDAAVDMLLDRIRREDEEKDENNNKWQ